MKRLFLPALCLLIACAGAKAQTDVSYYQPGVTVEGVTYFLPRTALRITVEAEKTVVTPGELNKYAFRYMRLQGVPTERKTTWVIKNVTIEPYGVPDKTKAFSILLKGRTTAPLVSLTKDGILLSINTQKAEETLPPVPKGTPANAVLNPRTYMSQEILSAGSSAKMAELCAQQIYDTRESRNDLIQGEATNAPKDGAQLQLMLDQIDTQTEALQQLFSGTTEKSTEYFSLDYVPTKETDKDVLFRFSSVSGVVDSDDLSGAPVYISVRNTGNLPQSSANSETDKKKAKLDKGVRYNVPAREKVTVYDSDYDYCTQEVSMGQFGYVEILGEALFDKKTTMSALFYQENGGLQKLEQ